MDDVEQLVTTGERPRNSQGELVPDPRSGRHGTHHCLRCGWRWTPRPETLAKYGGRPRACAQCFSTVWDQPPSSSRSARPDDEKFRRRERIRRDARRRRYRARLAKIKLDEPELLAEMAKTGGGDATNEASEARGAPSVPAVVTSAAISSSPPLPISLPPALRTPAISPPPSAKLRDDDAD